ncbi:MAG: helix-turn-helix domain-containing protein [Methylobacter sp.]|nr:helix-turn-helix domain-containing protein [Methylobacter sp.]MDP2097046.1 helix-turn-helix domain-containing protein [Methylobacter sp.]MDP2429468.1 helix-turn-helix domain-containing protein [Methylobacter sp.]MDP3055978.1 helix-turn-helix domain-containing protein [Methylobacter sp.]MDP3361838.1 helix-turn-helix domain-containing protein [Methylobacter sp.]
MSDNKFSTDSASQRNRLLSCLQAAPVTTIEARTELEIMHPGGRVQELRAAGHNIITQWAIDSTGKAAHRVAQYVLLSAV